LTPTRRDCRRFRQGLPERTIQARNRL